MTDEQVLGTMSRMTSHFETSPHAGEVWRVEFRCVPFSDIPHEVVTVHTRDGCEVSRTSVCDWFTQISKTSPSPLPVEDDRYLIKHFLIGTAWTMDDLYAKVSEDPEFKVLRLEAVLDEDVGKTLSSRFCYEDGVVEYFAAKTFYRRSIEKIIESEGVR